MPSRSVSRVAVSLAAVFLLLAALHVWWALTRVPDPVRPTFADEPLPQPPAPVTAGIAIPLCAAAVVLLARAGFLLGRLPSWTPRLACWGLGVILVFRAVGEFRFVGFFKTIRGTEFAVWDSWLYSPLSLLLGLAAVWLAATRD